jgi:hypothetical protein
MVIMRDQLIGYLLDALDPYERVALERKLADSAELRRELSVLQRSLAGLDADRGHYDPPAGLAEKTTDFIAQAARLLPLSAMSPDRSGPVARSRWSVVDLVVTAGILLAASLLFIPAVSQSRYSARLAGCQNNLRQLGVALGNYSQRNGKLFPQVPSKGRMAVAGIYANTLVQNGYLDNQQVVVCPASTLAENTRPFHVPTVDEIYDAAEGKLAELQRMMGGSYGYTLGYISKGRYHSTKNLGRPRFALMADSPTHPAANEIVSNNHGGRGQNVLFEDGHVAYLSTRTAPGGSDDIFLNDQGEVAAGMHRDDSVIAPSPAKPMIWPVALLEDE